MGDKELIHNGVKADLDASKVLLEKWKYPEIIGMDKVKRPGLVMFNNELALLRLIEKHIALGSRVVIHFDVDFDGISSGYIMYRELERRGLSKKLLVINKEKVHGILKKQVDYLNENNTCELLIIVDSSSNELELIKELKCDVAVIDHHEVNSNETFGKCNDGIHEFVIVNSTIECFDFEQSNNEIQKLKTEAVKNIEKCTGTQKMSCGLVVFEILRLWYTIYGNQDIIEKSRLYQWAAASLYTDHIDLIDERNQWYIENMNFDKTIDQTLLRIGQSISKYAVTLNKSYIQFKLAPLINKAIRADCGSEVLNVVVNKPDTAGELVRFDKQQKDVIAIAMQARRSASDDYEMLDTTELGISKNYNGVIAAQICGDDRKNVVVYQHIDGVYKGSFRGRIKGFDYMKKCFRANGIKADGHGGAFGFEVETVEKLESVMKILAESEPIIKHVEHDISLGNVDEEDMCSYHIESLDELRKSRLLVMMAYGNANVGSDDEINILASTKDLVLTKAEEKYKVYTLLGDLELIAFEMIAGKYFTIYVEYGDEIKLYARNIK